MKVPRPRLSVAPNPGLTDRGAMGMPLSSTGPIPSYLTQRLSRCLLSLVHVADQFWACWEGAVLGVAEGWLPGPGQV